MTLPRLTPADRCDADATGTEQAWVSARFTTGDTIQLCKHHFEQHELEIAYQAVEVNDQRGELYEAMKGQAQ